MCLILLAWKADPRRDLVIASNRDEYYSRPTAPANFWINNPDILGARDLLGSQRGSQLAVHRRNGRFACVTNIRNAFAPKKPNSPSRGLLVTRFLETDLDPASYLRQLSTEADHYDGFNLLLGDWDTCWHYSNHPKSTPPRQLQPGGVYALCNHYTLDPVGWPKVAQGRRALQQYLVLSNNNNNNNIHHQHREVLFQVLSDRTVVEEDLDLPQDTGYSVEVERALSSIFVQLGNEYGTRSSTVIERQYHHPHSTATAPNNFSLTTTYYCERTYTSSGEVEAEREYSFSTDRNKTAMPMVGTTS